MAQRVPHSVPRAQKSHLWLAAVDGIHRSRTIDDVAPAGGPERPLVVEFIGLTEAEQRAALAAFPGGRRFVLKPNKH